jgi:hypothetical protein
MQVDGQTAVFEGTPTGRVFELNVRFAPPPLRRSWEYLWHLLATPV